MRCTDIGTSQKIAISKALKKKNLHQTHEIVAVHNNNFPQSGPALQGCTVNVPVPKAVSS